MQELCPGTNGYPDDDGGVEYEPLEVIAANDWCPWNAETLGRYLRDPLKNPPGDDQVTVAIPVPRPGRWSVAAVRRWVDELTSTDGEAGVYVMGLVDESDVKIGETKRLVARKRELGYATFSMDEVVQHWFPTPSKVVAQQLETWFHEVKYRDQRKGRSEKFRKEGSLAVDLGNDDRMLAGCPWQLLRKVQSRV